MHDLFVYGSLICQDIMGSVAGQCHRLSEARLHDYRRLAVKNAHYPGIIAARGFTVNGVVYCAISDTGMIKLDDFEGGMYQRSSVEVELVDGSRRRVFTYVVKPAFIDQLDSRDWSYDEFLKHGKKPFTSLYMGYHRLAESD